MKDINFAALRNLVSNTPAYKIEDMGFADEDAFFAAAQDRVSVLKDFFSEVYFLEDDEEEIEYVGSDKKQHYYKFYAIEISFSEEEFIKIRDNVYDRGGDPNRIVLGVSKLFLDPDYSKVGNQTQSEKIKASYFVKF